MSWCTDVDIVRLTVILIINDLREIGNLKTVHVDRQRPRVDKVIFRARADWSSASLICGPLVKWLAVSTRAGLLGASLYWH